MLCFADARSHAATQPRSHAATQPRTGVFLGGFAPPLERFAGGAQPKKKDEMSNAP
ncbi:hypothetical protein CHLRE_09g403954v5 [Chlamydomonas reinhardtii]|uniref:Uncharacterized protein n=1 Tax=Chlamydomonas reinhardtii TaxID=3055 RepID=A0A2K3DCL4_CHLRE|nr:uncharacterized protein CHLRE_09g403954v5 [Chlamydomonas reinhardtii]PNW78277.1 hypothetical protein CHLRE_09g403954v5 [Chlamydomonas reinhardtii]